MNASSAVTPKEAWPTMVNAFSGDWLVSVM